MKIVARTKMDENFAKQMIELENNLRKSITAAQRKSISKIHTVTSAKFIRICTVQTGDLVSVTAMCTINGKFITKYEILHKTQRSAEKTIERLYSDSIAIAQEFLDSLR